jgi:hypothetical protein
VLKKLGSLILSCSLAASIASASDNDDAIFKEELGGNSSSVNDMVEEAPPKPEYPYPGSSEEGFAPAQPAAPKKAAVPDPLSEVQASGQPSDQPSAKPVKKNSAPRAQSARTEPDRAPPAGVQRPIKIDEDGIYYYGTDSKAPKGAKAPGATRPKDTNGNGEFFYDEPKTPAFSGRPGVEKPQSINARGEFFYPTDKTTLTADFSFRLGVMTSPNLKNKDNEVEFSSIYGSKPVPLLLGDYEYRLSHKVGRIGIHIGSGLAVASGVGQFVHPNPLPALEKFTFFVFPNEVTFVYKFQYSDDQLFVPYVEGGAGAFAFVELRDDNKPPKLGLAPVGVGAAGFSILIDGLDRSAVHELDVDYGIGHVRLLAEFRQFLGAGSYNFTSSAVTIGFGMEF